MKYYCMDMRQLPAHKNYQFYDHSFFLGGGVNVELPHGSEKKVKLDALIGMCVMFDLTSTGDGDYTGPYHIKVYLL